MNNSDDPEGTLPDLKRTQPKYPDSHSFTPLHHGLTHYRFNRPPLAGERVVVLIHGATVPMWEYDLLLPTLTNAGLCCLQYDLYGHGYSDRPACDYSIDLFVEQLTELLETIQVNTPVSIIGHSLGAAIAAAYTHKLPDKVSKLILCAPLVDFETNQRSLKLLKVPFLGEMLMYGFVIPMLIRRRAKRYHGLGHGRFPQMFKDQLSKPGFGRALLSLIRSGALRGQSALYEPARLHNKALLLARGSEDDVITLEQFSEICHPLPDATTVQPEGAGHAFMLTHPHLVANDFYQFLRE